MTPRLLETGVKSYNQIRTHVTNFGGAQELEMMFCIDCMGGAKEQQWAWFVQRHTYKLAIPSPRDVPIQFFF